MSAKHEGYDTNFRPLGQSHLTDLLERRPATFFRVGIVLLTVGHGQTFLDAGFGFGRLAHQCKGAPEFDVVDEAIRIQGDGLFETPNGVVIRGWRKFTIDESDEALNDDIDIGQSLMPAT